MQPAISSEVTPESIEEGSFIDFWMVNNFAGKPTGGRGYRRADFFDQAVNQATKAPQISKPLGSAESLRDKCAMICDGKPPGERIS